jgi:DNA-binding NtrC family response regulator
VNASIRSPFEAGLGQDRAMNDLATLRSGSVRPTELSAVAFRLLVVEGPDRGKSLTLDGATPGPTLVGTSPVCALCLTDPTVSRRHVSLEVIGRGLVVTDLRSTNGTRIAAFALGSVTIGGAGNLVIGSTHLQIECLARQKAPEIPLRTSFGGYFGASTEMRRLYPSLERLAKSDLPTLIEGETGTGKEVLAEALHREGPRVKKPFVVFDCTTIPPTLMESELFGHEKGAFSGATAARKGLAEQADGGTLFIDEIGDLDLTLQPRLLRLIDRGEVRRVGGNTVLKVNARILAATRRDLEEEVAKGRFRDDLFHRLVVGRICLPPLRERRGDVSLLAQRIAQSLGFGAEAIDAHTLQRWESEPWPGNIRELRNSVLRHLTLGDMAGASEDEKGSAPPGPAGAPDFLDGLLELELALPEARRRMNDEFERRYLRKALERAGGSVTRAAERSGIARRTFQQLRSTKKK